MVTSDLFPGGEQNGGEKQKEQLPYTPKALNEQSTQTSEDRVLALEKKLAQMETLLIQTKPIQQAAEVAGGYDGLVKALAAVLEKVAPPQQQYDPKKYYTADSIDKADWIEKPDVFLAYSVFFVIGDDKRKGFPVPTPYGAPIEFALQHTKVVRSGKADQILNFAVFKSHSRKVSAWLREHTKFNIKFFEWGEMKDNKSYDRISKVTKWADALEDVPVIRVMDMCKQHGVEFFPDSIQKSKLALIEKLTDDELQAELVTKDTQFKSEMLKTREATKNALEIVESSRG